MEYFSNFIHSYNYSTNYNRSKICNTILEYIHYTIRYKNKWYQSISYTVSGPFKTISNIIFCNNLADYIIYKYYGIKRITNAPIYINDTVIVGIISALECGTYCASTKSD